MRRRDPELPEPQWVKKMSDVEIVQEFKSIMANRTFTYERVGRDIVEMRKRLLKLLIDGLTAQESKQS